MPVASEYETPFSARGADQSIAAQVLSVDDILTDHPEPLHQPAEHPVGGKFYICAVVFQLDSSIHLNPAR
jgi:hypothetical protein